MAGALTSPGPAMFDTADPAFLADPYPAFARLREKAPVQWHEGLGLYVTLTHAAADAVLRDRSLGRIWRDRQPAELFEAFNLLHRTSMLENEPPTHTRLRRLVAGAFGRGHTERLRDWVQALADRLVAELAAAVAEQGCADLVTLVAEPLPVEVIAQLLAVPDADRGLLRPWSNAIVKMYEYGLPHERRLEAEAAAAAFVEYLRALVAERRARPLADDLVTDLVQASDGADRLTQDEIVGTCVLLLMAGHEATVNVVGNGMLAMLGDGAGGSGDGGGDDGGGDAWQQVVADPAIVVTATEEMLRFDSSLQLFERTATRPVELFGVRVEAGQKIAALLGAANRDPAIFAGADRFDPRRAPNPHLAFGAGIHFCLGAPLARVEVQAVLTALRSQLPGLRLAGEARRRPEFVIRGLEQLQVSATGVPPPG